MFAQVACLTCGKPFQVPREKLGQRVPCPWCGKETDAVPVAVDVQPLPADAGGGGSPRGGDERAPNPRSSPPRGEPPSSPPPVRRQRPLFLFGYGLLLLLVAGGVFVGLRVLGGTTFTKFVAPDGSCQAELPGSVAEVPVASPDELFSSGKRFVGSSWFGRVHGEVGWFDLSAEDVKLLPPEGAFEPLQKWRAEQLGAEVELQGPVKLNDVSVSGHEVRFLKGKARYVERYLFVGTGPAPRVYWVSVGGEKFDPESADALKVVGSLRVGK